MAPIPHPGERQAILRLRSIVILCTLRGFRVAALASGRLDPDFDTSATVCVHAEEWSFGFPVKM